MSAYVAPLNDMRFVLNELVGLDRVAELPGCEEASPDVVDAVLEEAGKFAGEVLAPLNRIGDKQGAHLKNGVVTTAEGFKDAYRKFCEGGWTALACQPKFGGQGLPYIVSAPVQEMWKAANLAFSLCPMLTQGAIEAIVHHASAELQQRFVPKMVAGLWTGTMNLTEPQAGSDLSAVRTKAVPEGDHYRVSGIKIFITWGEHDCTENIIHMVLARRPDAPEGVKGISLFIVPKYLVNPDGSLGKRNDVKCVSLEHKLGIHASPTAVMALGDKDGAIGYLVGEPNSGLEYMFTMMNHARLAVGLEGVAISERAYQQALAYAKERVQGKAAGAKGVEKATIIKHPDVRRMLMSMKAQTEAMRALAYFAAGAMDHANRHPDRNQRANYQAMLDLLIPVVKGWCTEQAIEIASTGIQVHGGMGFIEETGAAQHLRDARITSIYEGTTGIQANDLVGRKVGRENGVTARALLEQMQAIKLQLAVASGADFAAIRKSFVGAVDALAQATDWVVATYPKDILAAAASSVPYLKLMGTVCGGWQMARAALAAQARLDKGEGDAAFYKAKIITARFYADHILPLAGALCDTVVSGAAAVMALEENQF
jgi:alkylation response protein AidB-like acyl-CoA dehydrogenase